MNQNTSIEIALRAAYNIWGATQHDLQNIKWDDTETIAMRQIIVNKLSSEGLYNRDISEVIDRSESTVETDIYNHEQEMEDGYKGYVDNTENYEDEFDFQERAFIDRALAANSKC